MIIQIRGTNGSGKTTLARRYVAHPVKLAEYNSPLKLRPDRMLDVVGGWSKHSDLGTVCAVGSYGPAQGGLDTVPNFAVQQEAVEAAAKQFDHVICEGILASTVAGSWLDFFRSLGKPVMIAYLDTDVETCLANIKARQKAADKVRDIKEDLVRDKVTAIERTRNKFQLAGVPTTTLNYGQAEQQLRELLQKGKSCLT